MKLKHVDLIAEYVYQDARDVRTKFSKTFNTYFFSVGDEHFRIVEAWVSYLREEKLWGNDDRSSLRRPFPWGRLTSLKSQAWIGHTGAAPRPFARYFATPLSGVACPISTRTASETHLYDLAGICVNRLRNSGVEPKPRT
jgi:hypothetical protein